MISTLNLRSRFNHMKIPGTFGTSPSRANFFDVFFMNVKTVYNPVGICLVETTTSRSQQFLRALLYHCCKFEKLSSGPKYL